MRLLSHTLRVVLAGALLAGLAACSTGPADDGGEELVLGYAGDVAAFNPFASGVVFIGNWPIQAVYDSLLRRDGAGISSQLARAWEYDESRTVLTFELEEGIEFSDGTPFDAAAVKANIERHQGSESVAANRVANVEEVEILDDHSVALHLKLPNPEFLQFLGTWPVVSPAALGDLDALAVSPVGSGAYELNEEQTENGVSYVFDRKPGYWKDDEFGFERVVVRLLPDATARVNALLSDQIDLANVEPSAAAEVEGAGYSVQSYGGNWVGLSLGDKHGLINPALGDLRVRQAIAMAFDREAFVENFLLGFGVPTNQPFVEGQATYLADRADQYAYDPDEARRLLAEAGYPDGFELHMPSGGQYEPFVQQYLGEIGITAVFEAQTDDERFLSMTEGRHAAFVIEDGVLPTIRNSVLPGALWNGWGYTDPQIEAILETWRTGSDEEAAEAMGELGILLLDQAWFAVFAQVHKVVATSESVVAQADDVSGAVWLWDIELQQ